MSVSRLTELLTHEIELELNTDEELFLIKYMISNSDEDNDNDPVVDLSEVSIEGHDILDLLSEQIVVYIKLKIREGLNAQPDFDAERNQLVQEQMRDFEIPSVLLWAMAGMIEKQHFNRLTKTNGVPS